MQTFMAATVQQNAYLHTMAVDTTPVVATVKRFVGVDGQTPVRTALLVSGFHFTIMSYSVCLCSYIFRVTLLLQFSILVHSSGLNIVLLCLTLLTECTT